MCFQWPHIVNFPSFTAITLLTVQTWQVTLNHPMHFWSTFSNFNNKKKTLEFANLKEITLVKWMWIRNNWAEEYWCHKKKKRKKKRHAHNPVSVKNDDIIQFKFFIFVTEPWAKSNIFIFIYVYQAHSNYNSQTPEFTSNVATVAKLVVTQLSLAPSGLPSLDK